MISYLCSIVTFSQAVFLRSVEALEVWGPNGPQRAQKWCHGNILVIAHLPPTIPICTPNSVKVRSVVVGEIAFVENGIIIIKKCKRKKQCNN